MSHNKLNIVPITLHPTDEETSNESSYSVPTPVCIIKTSKLEIEFFKDAEDRIIQSVLKELILHDET